MTTCIVRHKIGFGDSAGIEFIEVELAGKLVQIYSVTPKGVRLLARASGHDAILRPLTSKRLPLLQPELDALTAQLRADGWHLTDEDDLYERVNAHDGFAGTLYTFSQ